MVTNETVGLIGLGQMGAAMCRTLLRTGWKVVAWDLLAAAVEAAVASGAEAASDPASVAARASLVVTSLPDSPAVRAVAFGHQGIAQAAHPGLLIIDTSTTSPAEARALGDELAEYGIAFIDAPVSGGVSGAEAGSLAVMVGGSAERLERARPLLSALGRVVVHCGPIGAGQVTKACNQLVVMATHEAVAEAMVLAQTAGLDPWRVREVLLAGYAASPILEIQAPKMLRHDFAPGGRARFHIKDIVTIGGLAAEAGLKLPAFDAAARQVGRLIDAGGGDLDNSALITLLEPSEATNWSP